ncbi:MAG: EAL domain-containing protein [Methylococcaceae bacterium]|nr:EAL domain-containing protein [Methylococcaceae bacterium]MDZ4157321.1 EAL domain-containing protein [Methylococcales bacterium]MDP2392610.1 EAL domain-containing protein [Methylococcaceae bacterium]MDP3021111.1 EAL domain-containing protein [Methylococcaceae bacterium]MDP3388497.1 EAL domain-containing protein [Methylococcaceae bacterium]
MLSESLKRKIIIIAETDERVIAQISQQLLELGFTHCRLAKNGQEIYRIVRDYYDNSDALGLVIVSEDLPDCSINELRQIFSGSQQEVFVPLLLLKNGSADSDAAKIAGANHFSLPKKTYTAIELGLMVNFLLLLKNEQQLRCKQQERLLTQLAERKVLDAKLKYLVAHDELTGLLNRNSLEQHIRLTLNRNSGKTFKQDSVLLFIDIDRFSLINELEGFEVGDRFLVQVICLIRETLNSNGLLARIGSDEFCLYLENADMATALAWAEKIRSSLDSFRFMMGKVAYSITVSIGISSLKSAKFILHPGELISQAHQACCMAKANGRNMIWEYSSQDTVVKERHRDFFWVPIIRDALHDQHLFLVFQPIVNLMSGDVSHYEALLRLRTEDGTIITPTEFIPAAERMGLIHGIDLWVIEHAIDYLAALPDHLANISLTINLSSVAFQDKSLLPTIKQKLEMTWVSAERITFEITETAAVDNFQQTSLMINQIRALGCRFALDDFGSGFSSFNYLKKFPVDYVKIDGQFIQNLANDETDRVLVRSMHQIAKKMGKKTIAEFVECPKTIEILREIGINYGQGYIFGRPSEQLLAINSLPLANLLPKSDKLRFS